MADVLSAAVGPGRPNAAPDVRLVQRLLDGNGVASGARVHVTGVFDAATAAGILTFQRRVMRLPFASGVVRPNDETFWRMLQATPRRMLAGSLGGIILAPAYGGSQLSDEDFRQAANALHCEVRAIKAVTGLESPNGPFDAMGRPPILFERHYFSRLTMRRFDAQYPGISHPVCGGYSFPERDQYVRLQRAFSLDATAALKSASWGSFQIMGDNHSAAGYGTVQQFVAAMCQSVRSQLDAFVSLLQHDTALLRAIQQKDWTAFARHYNGPSYAENRYDTKLAEAYSRATP